MNMGEHDAMCEKVLCTLENTIARDPAIREFAIVPTPENYRNKSPVLYEENCLGLESWCKPYLLSYTHSVLLKHRKKLSRKQLSPDNMKNLNHVLIGALLIQPSVTTFWNMKRELVEQDILSIEQELYFNELVLTMHSKSYEAFSYRKWLLSVSLKKSKDIKLFENEGKICERSALKSPNNYHSWNHRIWYTEQMWQIHPDVDKFILSELKFSFDWLGNHISEYTGYNYRQYLIKNLMKLKSASRTILENFSFLYAMKYLNLPYFDVDPFQTVNFLFGKPSKYLNDECYLRHINMLSLLLGDLLFISVELNYLYSSHECLWNYRKFLVIKLVELLYSHHDMKMDYKLDIKNETTNPEVSVNMVDMGVDAPCEKSVLPKKITSSNFYNILLRREIEFIEANKNTSSPLTFTLAVRHLKWLNHVNFYN